MTILYLQGSNLNDAQFLYIDIGVLVPLCIFQSWTGAYHSLTSQLPQESLFSPPVLVSVLGSAAIQFCFQFYLFLTIENDIGDAEFEECVPAEDFDDDDPPCSYNTMLYEFTCMQYIICCLCFSISKPFRKAVWTNPLYLFCVIVMTAYQTYLIFFLDDWSEDAFGLLEFPTSYKWKLFILVCVDGVVTYLYEKILIQWFCQYWNRRTDLKIEDERKQKVE